MYRFIPIRKSYHKFQSIYFFLLALATSLVISLPYFNLQDNLIAFSYLVRIYLYLVFFIFLQYDQISTKTQRPLKHGIAIFIVITLITSFLQYFLYPNLRNLSYLGWDPHQYRVFGVFLDTSVAAAMFGLVTLFLLGSKISIGKKVMIGLYSLLGLLTYSRSFYLAMTFTISAFLITLKRYLLLGIFFVSLVISLVLIPKPGGEGVNLARTFSIESRLNDYKQGLRIWSASPLVGIGYNHIRALKNDEYSHAGGAFHSSFLTIAVGSGALGLILYIYMLIKLSGIGRMGRYYVVFLSIYSLFDNVLLHPFTFFLLLVLLSLELSLSRTSR